MNKEDYTFRCIALFIVWCGIAVPAIIGDVFLPIDLLDMILAGMLLGTGVLLTLVIWCGPQFVAVLGKRKSKQEGAANQSSDPT
jgi:hypothetical protein